MSINKMQYNASDILNYPANHHDPTTQTNYANNVKNWVETEKNLVDTVLWQPTTAYTVGNMVKTPSLNSQWWLLCTVAGTSGANEPSYSGKTVGSSIIDGSVTWTICTTLINPINVDEICRSDDNGYLYICGGSGPISGAQLSLFGKDEVSSAKGSFVLWACSANNDNITLVGQPDGTLTWGGRSIVHEQAKTTGSGSTSMSSTALATNLASLNLSAGTWIVSAKIGFSPNNNGNRALMIYHNVNSNKVSDVQEVRQSVGAMDLNGTAIVCLSAATTVYLQGYQTSGSNLTVTWEMRAQKLSDYTSFGA